MRSLRPKDYDTAKPNHVSWTLPCRARPSPKVMNVVVAEGAVDYDKRFSIAIGESTRDGLGELAEFMIENIIDNLCTPQSNNVGSTYKML